MLIIVLLVLVFIKKVLLDSTPSIQIPPSAPACTALCTLETQGFRGFKRLREIGAAYLFIWLVRIAVQRFAGFCFGLLRFYFGYLCCGQQDGLVVDAVNRFVGVLDERCVPYIYCKGDGNHELDYWERHLDDAFSFLAGIESGTKNRLVLGDFG